MIVIGRKQQRGLECTPPRSRERSKAFERRIEEIPERGEGKVALRFGRPRQKHLPAVLPRRVHAGLPKRRLADPGLALEHERSGAGCGALQELKDPRKLLL